MKKTVFMIMAVCLYAFPANAVQYELDKGFDGFAWGAQCAQAFSGKGWVEENRTQIIWEPNTKNLSIEYGDGTGPFTLYRNIGTDKRQERGVLTTYYGCKRDGGGFTFVCLRISMLKYKEIKNFLYKELGDHTKKFGPVRTWDSDKLYIQLTQNMLLVYHK
ncbi:MAG: hypothetical protein HY915_02300 [Desulfovibrio sp.]|nr:hypothetical protein [Desulfovibrio sp.]